MLIVSEADSYAPLRSPQGDQALAERSILDAPPWGSSQNHEAMGDKDRTDATELPLRHSPEGGGDGKSGDGKGGAEKVSGLNGTAAWGARIYGDGRRTGDSPDRFGRVVLADSTAEQHASRMKGVGRFP